jgi:hypothetical protein
LRIEIELKTFYAKGDESRFFSGLNQITAISNVTGVGRNLLFDIDLASFGKEQVRELIALLWRCQIMLEPIFALGKRNKKYAWIHDPIYYWHKPIGSK